MVKLKDLLMPFTVKDYAYDDTLIKTSDLVFVDSCKKLKSIPTKKRKIKPTDFASKHMLDSREEAKTYIDQILSDYAYSELDGKLYNIDTVNEVHGVCPCIHVKLNKALIENITPLLGQRTNSQGEVFYHTFKFGVYPQTKRELETEFSALPESYFTKTGKIFVDTSDSYFSNLDELFHKGKKYIRCFSFDGDVEWFEVQPIVWRIRNWKELPKTINPHGTGTAKYLDLKSEKALLGLYFHEDLLDNWNDFLAHWPSYRDLMGAKDMRKLSFNCQLWQNSIVRGFLNGIDVNFIKNENGNPDYGTPCISNFEQNNFIKSAMDMELSDFIKLENPFYNTGYLDLD